MSNKEQDQEGKLELIEIEDKDSKQAAQNESTELVAVGDETNSLLMSIQRIAEMPGFEIDRAERLFTMREQMIDREQEKLFNQAMALTQSEIQSVAVNKDGEKNGSRYADLNAIHKEAKPIWTKHGFSVVSRSMPSETAGCIQVYCEVRHSGGHKEIFKDDWPIDVAGPKGLVNKTAIQGKGSTISYARRYTELMIFDIAIAGEDDDGNSNELSAKAADWIAAITECANLHDLQKKYQEAFKDLDKDGYGRNQIGKAKDAMKAKLRQ